MKQRLLTMLIVFCCTAYVNKVAADPVTRLQAQKNVYAFLEKKGFKKDIPISESIPSKGDEPENYYVFNVGENNGFVIAAGDDCVPAILGYSDKGFLVHDAIPENMKTWLQGYEDQIAYMKENGLSSDGETSSIHPAISPLLTTTWGQDDPYNQNCPDFFSYGKCVTGCVATAMAQIMYYHRQGSVKQTTTDIPAYQCRTNWTSGDLTLGHISVNAIPSGAIIDWDNMLDSYSGSSTTEQQQAVANLMVYCGASVNMNYADSWNGGSGAYSEDVPGALIKYFDYSEHVTLEKRANYTDDEWDILIYSELSKGNPIYYSGQNSSAGHAFVCDGYDGDGYYHINWGWTGTSDGFFLLSVLDPKEQGIGGSVSGYNQSQAALICAVPNSEVVRMTTQDLSISDNSTYLVSQGDNISLSIDITLKNLTGSTHGFDNAIGLYSKGSLVEIIKELSSSNNLPSGSETTQSTTLQIRTNLESGVYHLIPISKESDSKEWNKNGNTSELDLYITLVFKDGIMSFFLGKPTVTTEVISFEDNEVKRICVENWDTDGDGEISYEEAATVSSFGSVFNKSSIKTFNEAQFFTGIKEFGLCSQLGGCKSLVSIKIPSSVTTIKDNAFYGCSFLKTILIPSSVKYIRTRSFYGCNSLEAINLPEGLLSIEASAFNNCASLTAIIIPSSVTTIGDMAFGGCTSLTNFEVETSNSHYCAIDGVLFTKDRTDLVQFPANREGNYSIPNGTSSVKYGAFYKSKISEVAIPNSVKGLETFAFWYATNLLTISIPNSVISIGKDAFENCNNLESVLLPEDITSLSSNVFANCKKLKNINLPSKITTIGSYAFSGCTSLTEIEIPNKVTSIGSYAFRNSGLKKVTCLRQTPCSIENTVFKGISNSAILYVPLGCKDAYALADNWNNFSIIMEIGGDQPYVAFNNGILTFYNDKNRDTCEGVTYDLNEDNAIPGWYDNRASITKVVFNDSFSTVLPVTTCYWFSGCNNLTEIQGLDNLNTANVTNMRHMFYNCSKLTSITLPTNLSKIYERQFYGCSQLSAIAIPNSVTEIDPYAFNNCSGLTSITISNNLTSIGQSAFDGCRLLQSISFPNSLEAIGYRAFFGCQSFNNSITIPASVTSIGDNAFGNCSGINDFVVNNSNPNYCTIEGVLYTKDGKKIVQYPANREGAYAIQLNTETIGDGAFYGSKITSVDIPLTITSIESYSFSSCSLLKSVEIPSNVSSIGSYAFQNCYSLNQIILPGSLLSISDFLLYGCNGLEKITLPEHITLIGRYSLSNCSSLTQVVIPSEVTSIGRSAFSGCRGLTSITMGNKVSSIDGYAFAYCTSITDVYTKANTIPTTNNAAFASSNIGNATLHVPAGSVEAYNAVAPWSNFKEIVPLNETIKMQTGSGSARTAIGYSSENGLDFTNVNDVKAWIATGYTEDGTVLLTRVKIVPPNTGLFLTTTNAGVELSVPTTTSDVYYANLLLPIITKETITPTETIDDVEYQNFAVGTLNNGQMGFVTVTSNIQIGPNKSRLRVPSRYYTSTAQTRGGMQLEFIDDVSTGLRQMPISENADAIFDLQGRKVHNPVRGLYIKNGKKVIIR